MCRMLQLYLVDSLPPNCISPSLTMLVNRFFLESQTVSGVDQVYKWNSARWFRKSNACRSWRVAAIWCEVYVVLSSYILHGQISLLSALPMFLADEKERATTRYVNITTIATFFSSVTATTLQMSISFTQSSLWNVVNFFWFISLVFSVSSGVSSLLGMTWRGSKMWVWRVVFS